ncbi:hypothetical protein [Caballeronia sp. GAWG2-1]|uniref:hypothetical protein n=1 Tax=Caballeronia sp. GAWG2-1 TaxID=2921744 RepID=UPI0020287DDF|nr:hypothetical protein [Caballeronia sp. GAWG2-1]
MVRFRFDIQMISAIESRKFAHTRLVSETTSIGNFEEVVLLESLELSVLDLIARLSKSEITIENASHSHEVVFSALYDAAWNGEVNQIRKVSGQEYSVADARNCIALPTGVEAFDGELAFLYQTGLAHRFVWRDWDSKDLRVATIQKTAYLKELGIGLRKIQANK